MYRLLCAFCFQEICICGVWSQNVHASAELRFFKQRLTVRAELVRRSLPPTGAVPPGGRLVVVLARLSPARRPALPAYGGARRCGGLLPGSATPPRPSRGLARSGVPPSRLGRAVAAYAADYLCGVGFAVRLGSACMVCPGQNWVHTIISIFDAPNLGLAAQEPLHQKLRGEV